MNLILYNSKTISLLGESTALHLNGRIIGCFFALTKNF